MKRLIIAAFVLLISVTGKAQFREDNTMRPSIKDGIINTDPNFILGIIDPAKFSMSHSINLSYTAFGGNGFALSSYTNSMMYRFADNLNVQLDASIVQSPYSSLGKSFQNSVNGIYITKARLNYQPWENVNVVFQYQQYPHTYLYGNPFGRGSWYDASQP
ncbi:MAG: hypothetical protein LWX56_11445 [Ignavibacteria bacterium]|nr:hypothetical protein [Ignavibacteria bacterium]